MAKRKKYTVITIVESALLLVFVVAAIVVVANLRPATFTASDGSTVSGWRWGGKVYVDAEAFTTGMDAALDVEALSITYTEPVDPEQIRAETTEAMTLQFSKDADAHADAIAELEAQIAEQAETIEELQARIDELEGKPSASSSGAGRDSDSSGTGSGNNGQAGSSSAGSTGGSGGGGSTPTPSPTPAPTPAPAPAPPPAAPAVDAGACIAAARAHALALGMTEDSILGIGNSGYLNSPDISVLTQDNVIASLIYCLNQYASYAPDDHSLVHFNIVQSGSLIYALYQ